MYTCIYIYIFSDWYAKRARHVPVLYRSARSSRFPESPRAPTLISYTPYGQAVRSLRSYVFTNFISFL